MADTNVNETTNPVFQIQRLYLKDASLEQPNSPEILLQQKQPGLEMKLNLDSKPVSEGVFEVTVTATVQTTIDEKTLFLVEAKQAGLFEIRNMPADQLNAVLGITCPQIVYPYLRSNVADIVQRAGFPPVHLTEINFQALYQQQQAEAAGGAGAAKLDDASSKDSNAKKDGKDGSKKESNKATV